MKKKLIAVFLVVATLLSCVFAFTACNKDKDKGNGGKNSGTNDETFDITNVERVLRHLISYASTLDDILIIYNFPETKWDGGGTPESRLELVEGEFVIYTYKTEQELEKAIADSEIEDHEYFAKIDSKTMVYCYDKNTYEKVKNADISKCALPARLVEDFISYVKIVKSNKKGGVSMEKEDGYIEFRYSTSELSKDESVVGYYLLDGATGAQVSAFNAKVAELNAKVSEGKAEVLSSDKNHIKVKML